MLMPFMVFFIILYIPIIGSVCICINALHPNCNFFVGKNAEAYFSAILVVVNKEETDLF